MTTTFASDSFTSHASSADASASFAPTSVETAGLRLPRGLREEAAGMSWAEFTATYAPTGGPIRLGSWSARTCGLGQWEFRTTFGVGTSIRRAEAVAPGPMSALTALLHDSGCPIEILGFHQQQWDGRTATLVLCEAGGRSGWAFGLGEGTTESALRAMVAAANRLHG